MLLSYYRCIKTIKRTFKQASTRQKFTIFGVTIILLWVVGLLDKLSEKSYDEFSWPREISQNQESTKFTTLPECKFVEDGIKLMIIVKSSAMNTAMRESVRRTWGSYRKERGVEVMPVFIVGRLRNMEVMRKVDKEVEQFKDILAIPAIDSYRNNTYKLFGSIDYAAKPFECSTPDFVLLVDDDYMVHVPNLVSLVKTKSNTDNVYEGFVFDTSPFRLKIHKHSISIDEYPYARYPPYVSAGAVFTTARTIKTFQESMRSLKMFPFDDVFTGILAKTTGIEVTHNENFVFWSRHITKKEWNEGVIAAHGFARKNLEDEYAKLF